MTSIGLNVGALPLRICMTYQFGFPWLQVLTLVLAFAITATAQDTQSVTGKETARIPASPTAIQPDRDNWSGVYGFESAFLRAYGDLKQEPRKPKDLAARASMDMSQTISLPPIPTARTARNVMNSQENRERLKQDIVPLPPSSGSNEIQMVGPGDPEAKDQIQELVDAVDSGDSRDHQESRDFEPIQATDTASNQLGEMDGFQWQEEDEPPLGDESHLPDESHSGDELPFSLPEQASDWQREAAADFPALPTSSLNGQELIGSTNPTFFVPDEDMDKFWWKKKLSQPLHPDNQTSKADTRALVYSALKNSPRIRAISQEPLVRDLQVTEAESSFDPVSFLSSQFDDRVDPVGNTLTTGGAPFLLDHIFSTELGLRRKLAAGGELELSQLIGFQNSNSRFFVPQDQGTATLALNFSQPLLRGRGRYYNQSQILVAQAAEGVAWNSFQAQLQEELKTVVRSYWRLYYDRSIFMQKRRNVARGEKILSLLEGRQGLDSLPSQIARARSSVFSRKAELANAYRDVRNAETNIRRRIADPNWAENQFIEILPTEMAEGVPFDMPLEQIVYTALDNRPEIKESLRQAKIASIQYDVSQNELLPELTLLMNSYISALEGDTGIEVALSRQFTNTPGYSVGLNFEFPIGNRSARSRLAQRHIQKVKIQADLDENIQTVIAEAQVANRTVKAALETLEAAEVAIEAARMDLIQQRNRWEAFALVDGDLAEGQTPTTILDQLLDAQDRLADAELVYSQAELELKLAEIELQRAMGTLLIFENVTASKTNGLCPAPQVNLNVSSDQEVNLPEPQYSIEQLRKTPASKK